MKGKCSLVDGIKNTTYKYKVHYNLNPQNIIEFLDILYCKNIFRIEIYHPFYIRYIFNIKYEGSIELVIYYIYRLILLSSLMNKHQILVAFLLRIR